MDRVLAELIRLWATRLEDEIDYVAEKVGREGNRHLDGLDALLDEMHRTIHALEEGGRHPAPYDPVAVS